MDIEEQGLVVEERGPVALVKAVKKDHCAGCGAAEHCRGGSGGERLVEAQNDIGASKGATVVLAVPSGAFLKASFMVYMVPVIGILAGAGAAQLVVAALAGPRAAGMAAGLGGLAGVFLAVAGLRLYRRRHPESVTLRPRIVRIV